MRVLLDVNVPRRLRRLLPGHEISTAQEQGWGRITNGELLQLAEQAAFDVMITADRNIAYQQNLSLRTIAIITLSTNDWSLLKHAGNQISGALERTTPNSFQVVRL